MTVISVAIGVVFSRVPDALMTSLPVGEVAGVALLVVFGVKALRAAYAAGGDGGGGGAEEELQDAQSAVAEAESSGKVRARGAAAWASLLEVASLVFLAEWGDRSMLATIALGEGGGAGAQKGRGCGARGARGAGRGWKGGRGDTPPPVAFFDGSENAT